MVRVVLLLGLLLAPSAWAAEADNWLRGCQPGAVTRSLQPGSWACYVPVTAGVGDESPVLSVSDCSSVDVLLFDDRDGDGTVCGVAWTIEQCPIDAAVDTDAEKDNACAIASGTAALSGNDAEANLGLGHLRMSGGGAGANPTDCQIEVHCRED